MATPPSTVQWDDTAILIESEGGTTRSPWSQVQQVAATPQHVLVVWKRTRRLWRVMVLPRAALAAGQAEDLERRWRAAHAAAS